MNINWEKIRNRKSMKVTDFKTRELNENAMKRKNIHEFERNYVNLIFGSNRAFHLFLKVSFFFKGKSQ